MSGLLEHFRNLLATKVAGKGRFVETTDMFAEKYLKETELFTKADILRLLNIITSTEQALRFAPQPRVRFELGLIQMASLDKSIEIESLLNEIKNFKGGIPAIAEERVQYQPATKPIEPKIQHPVQQEPQKKAPKLDLSVQEVEIPQPKTEAHQIKNIKENNVEAQKLSNSINSGVDAESLRQGWNAFIEKYAYTENGFHILTQSEFFRFEFLNSEVVIYVNSEFAYEQIYRARLNIASFMREFYGGEAKPRILHDDGSQVASNYVSDKGPVKISKPVDNSMSNDTQTKNETSQTAKPAKMQNKQVSEVEQKIIDLFGAREV
jgi:DNA polymerase III gamma/tau subunit